MRAISAEHDRSKASPDVKFRSFICAGLKYAHVQYEYDSTLPFSSSFKCTELDLWTNGLTISTSERDIFFQYYVSRVIFYAFACEQRAGAAPLVRGALLVHRGGRALLLDDELHSLSLLDADQSRASVRSALILLSIVCTYN